MASQEPLRVYSSLAVAQVAVPTTAGGVQVFLDARLVPADEDPSGPPLGAQPKICHREITNTDAANPIFVGKDNTVTILNGHQVTPGQTKVLASPDGSVYLGPVFAIAKTATVVASTMEF